MNKQLERILKIVGDLTKEDLTLLNQTVSDLIKDHQKIEFTEAVKTMNYSAASDRVSKQF